MKILINWRIFSKILILFILTVSCRNELNESTYNIDSNQLIANSKISNLIHNISLNDGSLDNILDNASCFSIKLPVTIMIDDQPTIMINSKDDFKSIEKTFTENEDNPNQIIFSYPITLIFSDFSEISISNAEQLKNQVEQCSTQIEDEDIECIDFLYPFSVSFFDARKELIETITFSSDKSLFQFISNISSEDIAEIQFPINIILPDNSTNTINDLDQLENSIEAAVNDCDEEDLSSTYFKGIILDKKWIIESYENDGNNETADFANYTFEFLKNNIVSIVFNDDDGDDDDGDDPIIITGKWLVGTNTTGKLYTTFNFSDKDPLYKISKKWYIEKVSSERISLTKTEEGIETKLILKLI